MSTNFRSPMNMAIDIDDWMTFKGANPRVVSNIMAPGSLATAVTTQYKGLVSQVHTLEVISDEPKYDGYSYLHDMSVCIANDSTRLLNDIPLGIEIKPWFKFCNSSVLCTLQFDALADEHVVQYDHVETSYATRTLAEEAYNAISGVTENG